MVRVRIFFFQAVDGIRDLTVTGVQTCALPISATRPPRTGPPETPTNCAVWNTPMPILRRCGGNVTAASVVSGAPEPPTAPCNTRSPTTCQVWVVSPIRPYTATAAVWARVIIALRPKRSDRLPQTGLATIIIPELTTC